MNCPVCVTERLVITERSGIEIDYCPKCRGVWLDRGELDKIIERAEKNYAAPRQEYKESSPYHRESRKEYHGHNDGHYHNQKHHKKESFWSDLFD